MEETTTTKSQTLSKSILTGADRCRRRSILTECGWEHKLVGAVARKVSVEVFQKTKNRSSI